MDSKKQKLLIELLISSSDTFALCQNIIKPDYFDPEFRNAVRFIKQYYEEYSTTPGVAQIEAESDQVFKIQDIKRDEIQYCAAEIERFCKQEAMRAASLALPALVKAEKYAEADVLVREATLVSLQKNLGLRYFDTVNERLERMLNEDPTHPTGWTDVDKALFGGISRKELLLVSANSGGGKSITLANLAFNFAVRGLNVLYISLELSEDIVAQRFDTMHTGISREHWREHTDEIAKRINAIGENSGIIDIIQMGSGTTANEIRSYLKEYYLHYEMQPDLLIIDYLDKMAPNEKVSADNVFEKDKRCSEQIRDIAVDFNMFLATASQLNRSAVNTTEHDHSHIAGGISKINEADVYWSIIMTKEMKALGKMLFVFQKTRNSDGNGTHVHLKWDNKFLRIRDGDGYGFDAPQPLVLNKKNSTDNDAVESIIDNKPTGNKLTSMLSSFTS